ncbi:MAG: hypothetical protein WDN04_22965 [Rhodospirillales bacterium]
MTHMPSRRLFLQAGLAAGGGLLIGLRLPATTAPLPLPRWNPSRRMPSSASRRTKPSR